MADSLYQKKWFEGEYTIDLVAYYLINWENYNMKVHEHNFVEVMYVIKGKCTIEAQENTYRFTNGDLILIDASIPHRIVMSADEKCRMLNVEFGFIPRQSDMPTVKHLLGDEFIKSRLFEDANEHVAIKDNADVYAFIATLVNELSKNGGNSNRIVQMQAAQLLLKMASLYEDRNAKKHIKSIVYIRQATDYLYSHYFEEIRAENISENLGINPNYLQRIFKQNTGSTIVDFLNNIRMEKAKELLAGTDIAIADLCIYVGINSRQYFSHLFKKHTGVSPITFRKTYSRTKQQ